MRLWPPSLHAAWQHVWGADLQGMSAVQNPKRKVDYAMSRVLAPVQLWQHGAAASWPPCQAGLTTVSEPQQAGPCKAGLTTSLGQARAARQWQKADSTCRGQSHACADWHDQALAEGGLSSSGGHRCGSSLKEAAPFTGSLTSTSSSRKR